MGRVARAWAELMHRLGYERYGAQGGDLGALITPALGRVAPESVIGIHVNATTVGFAPLGPVPDDVQAQLTDQERQHLASLGTFSSDGSGYMAIQSTRPQTLAYGLTDSPVGQLARITEKFKEWSNPSAELPEDAIDRDTLLTNVTLCWLTSTAGSAARMYYESSHNADWFPSPTPGCRQPWRTSPVTPRSGAGLRNPTPSSAGPKFDRGGHFAALEAPDLLTDDIRQFFSTLR